MSNVICMRDLEDALNGLRRKDMHAALVRIASLLSFDDDGMLSPSDSLAADSAADFVDAVSEIFDNLGIDLGDPE